MLEHIDFKSGIIEFNDFSTISSEEELRDSLLGDFLLVNYPQGYSFDVAWRGGFNKNGDFLVTIIKDSNWEEPILIRSTRNTTRLEQYIQEAVDLITLLVEGNTSACNNTQEAICNFDQDSFTKFFDYEYVTDKLSGSYDYSKKIGKQFEFSMRILGIDEFVAIRLEQKKLELPIFDIGFEGITYLEIIHETNDMTYLNLYRKTYGKPTKDQKPFQRIMITPQSAYIELTVL